MALSSCGTEPEGMKIPFMQSMNQWKTSDIDSMLQEARIVIDGSQSAEVKERLDRARPFNLTTSRLVIGASVDYKEGFVGCLRSFLINGQLVDLKVRVDKRRRHLDSYQ